MAELSLPTTNPVAPWGFHLIIDAGACNKALITNKRHVEHFARMLVKEIDMVAFGEPQVIHFGDGDKEGFTLVQLIQTSNICAHFCNDTGDAYFDVFSCKPFDAKVAEDCIRRFFSPDRVTKVFLHRKA